MFQIQLCPLSNFGARFAMLKNQTELRGSYIAVPAWEEMEIVIALDYLYDQGITEKQINVFDAVLLLLQQRINMVQTKNQYLYLHEVLCEALCTVGEILENTAFIDTPRTSDSLNQEYQHICKSHIPDREEGWTDGEYTLVLDGEKSDNLNKNADLCVVPDDRYRPVLNMTLNTLGQNDYINVVYISTFGEKDMLILTQSALVSSAIDCVRLFHDHVIRTVVTFADEVEPYMPGSSESCLIGPFTATTKSDTHKQVYKESVVQFKYIAEYEGFEVRIIRFTKWSNTLDFCNIKDLMSLLISVQECACRRPVVLQCRLFAVL
ncbi:receptor-type tyrosine-protein phosphatase U-like isoform X2 [Dreissena polymorpha]|uniref:receptor-type tyrosine-protein phosphatase U-like isoform X2 n=1 Tax=Dreissena polymorpha TaxID=45954 RepID=UPI0022644356|nr:receptor-type tyrosine-protein phosphatase U-like isoform X2 [Dreissena polymorpha]